MTSVLPKSILDTDLYKLTMQQAVSRHFPHAETTYRFTNRDKHVNFSKDCVDQFRQAVSSFSTLALTPQERNWLEQTCPYFSKEYLDYLSAFRFKPEQVKIEFVPTTEDGSVGQIEIETHGPWVESILWEVPLMATLSEIYFKIDDTDWTYEGQEELAYEKGKALYEANCVFSEFGTRRRRSFRTQELVVQQLKRVSEEITNTRGRFTGTSNVHLARKYNLAPIGTIAHEWFMGIGALQGYEQANDLALQLWEDIYSSLPNLLIALTDTFSTKAFFKNFTNNPERARKWTGLRQDSGDPLAFAPAVKKVYKDLGIDYHNKLLVYSDALNLKKAIEINAQCQELGFEKVFFGIGTFLSNDFGTKSSGLREKSKALNMVIKISTIDGQGCVKISDDLNKNTGDKNIVAHVKDIFDLST